MSSPPPDPARRRLLARSGHAAVAGAALAVLAPAATALPAAHAPAAAPRPRRTRGYHETEHTARYYALARF